jgi:hypothetical protein
VFGAQNPVVKEAIRCLTMAPTHTQIGKMDLVYKQQSLVFS